jgi:hypothetical protein
MKNDLEKIMKRLVRECRSSILDDAKYHERKAKGLRSLAEIIEKFEPILSEALNPKPWAPTTIHRRKQR